MPVPLIQNMTGLNIRILNRYECRKCFNQYVAKLIDPNSNAVTKRLWSYIKSKKLDHTGVSMLKHQGSTYNGS